MHIGLKQMPTQQLQQRLIMTPKLQQAIKVLLMSRLDLTQYVTQQLEQNIFLDDIQEELDIDELSEMETLDPDAEWNEPQEILDREDKEPDIDWENCFDDMISSSEKTAFEHWNDEDHPQADVAQPESLQDFLMAQLNLLSFSEKEWQIGEQIIGNLDDDGRLKVTPLFRIDLKFQMDLNDGTLSESLRREIEGGLRREFQKEIERGLGQKLQEKEILISTITVKDKESRWVITDKNNSHICTVKKEEDCLNIYSITLEDIVDRVGCEVDEVEKVLHFIQNHFEPTGIAYRTVPETLLLQMKVAQIDHPLAEEVIKNYFEDLVNNRLPRIAQNLNVEIDKVLEASKLIGTLHPYPGRHFSDCSDPTRSNDGNAPVRLIIPDVTVQKVDGKYRVITNEDGMPQLRLNPYYVNMMRNGHQKLDSKTKVWMENYKSQAWDLIKSINQRRQTIARVTEAIFDMQADFLEEGVTGLKPLVLRQIAEMAGVHESTVSRVTSNKYVETPQGIYKLKYFFSGEVLTDSGLNMAATTVKDKIKEMIDKEDLAKPISDQEIAEALKSGGIQVARRTVAKYRVDLGILPSGKRRREW